MRKLVVALIIGLAMVMTASAATSLNWQSDMLAGGTAPDVWDTNGTVVPKGSDWYLQLYNTGDTTWSWAGNRTGGEFAHSTTAFSVMAGVVLQRVDELFPWGSGATVGTRLYNNVNPAIATAYAVGTLTTTLPTLVGDPIQDPISADYNFGEIRQQDWIPEPVSAMLVLVGVCTVVYRRRRMTR